MISRITFRRVTLAFLSLGCLAMLSQRAVAFDVYWKGPGTNYNLGSNWVGGFVPAKLAGVDERGVIGTTDASGLIDGVATLSSTPSDPGGGLALGLDAGTTGSLTISSGTLQLVTTNQADLGADGRTLVGVGGRGYLTMTGGTLNTLGLVVDGDSSTAGNGTSHVDLSGSATVNVTGSAPNGLATFNRRLSITGPGVTFNSGGRLRLNASNTYNAGITALTHSALKTDNAAVVGGALNVEFGGAGATHSLGQTWDLVDAALGIQGTFNNLSPGGDVPVSGLPGAIPSGAAYHIKTVTDGGRTKMRLAYEEVLVLQVNRDTGELTIQNPQNGAISIDSYTVSSGLGSMLTSFDGISGSTPVLDPDWTTIFPGGGVGSNTVNRLTEFKVPDFSAPIEPITPFNLSGVANVPLGVGFNPLGVAANSMNFGTDGEDLIFTYSGPGSEQVLRGQVEYVGTTFENNLVLRVNPNTGQAFLKNDSLETLVFDNYTINSSTGALSGAGWTGLGSGWEKTPASSGTLAETNQLGSITLEPNQEAALGDIGAFATQAAQDGLSLKFVLLEGLEAGGDFAGDFDNDGDVDGSDFLAWQRGEVSSPPAAGDLTTWRSEYGLGQDSTGFPEDFFRFGSIVFDATAGLGAVAAIPEPTSTVLMLSGVSALALVRRRRQLLEKPRLESQRLESQPSDNLTENNLFAVLGGDQSMYRARRIAACAGLVLALTVVSNSYAVTQGISLTNNRFELPGPTGDKTVAFDDAGVPIAGIIPGWTFGGPGVELFGDEVPGDSGTEGGGNPGNELILSTKDGIVYQTATGFALQSIPATQQYVFSFDAVEIFAQSEDGLTQYTGQEQTQLTTRFYYGAARTTLTTLVLNLPNARNRYEVIIPSGSPLLSGAALGQPIGVEFDTTTTEFNPLVERSWSGVDNVVMQIAGVTPGDFDGDGDVDIADYRIIRDNLETSSDFLADGDLTRDGTVDALDFRAWKSLPSVVSSGVLAQIAAIPEPSTAALTLIMGVTFVGSLRRRAVTKMKNTPLVVGMFAALCFALAGTSAQAELLLYEPFDIGANAAAGEYTVGAVLGQNPTTSPTTFLSGPWAQRVDDGDVNAMVQATGLSFLGAPASGGSLTSAANSRDGRNLDEEWDASTEGTYYISYMVNFGAYDFAEGFTPNQGQFGYRGIEMWNAGGAIGNDGDLALSIGYNEFFSSIGAAQQNPFTARMYLNVSGAGNHQIIENSPDRFIDDGATHLIVLKFELSAEASSDTVSLFLDPTNNDEPILPGAQFANIDFTLGALGGPVRFAGLGENTVVDEIRVGTEFIDVLPEFPLRGDTNGDGFVDELDYLAIASNMNATGVNTAQGDVSGDGRVTILDYRIWNENRTDLSGGIGTLGSVQVPEPTSLVVAALALLTLATRRGHA